MLKVCSGVTNEKEKDGGARGLVGLWSKRREGQGLRYELSVRACTRGLNQVVLLDLNLENWNESIGTEL